MVIPVGNKQAKEEENLIQKYLALLRCGKHNLQAFHKQENTGQEDRARRGEESAPCSSACCHGGLLEGSEMELGRWWQCTALNWEGLAAAATKGSLLWLHIKDQLPIQERESQESAEASWNGML